MCYALVDTGASELCQPAEAVESLNIQEIQRVNVQIAGVSKHSYHIVGIVEIEVLGRSTTIEAIELPEGAPDLQGAFPLEGIDWHISPREGWTIPNAASTDGEPVLYEVGVQRLRQNC